MKVTGFIVVLVFFLGPIPFTWAQGCGTCSGELSITSVSHEGKVSGNDVIRVRYTFVGSSAEQHCLVASKLRFDVRVTRKNGHQDSISSFFNCCRGSEDVQVPRGALETDPVRFEVTGVVTEFTVKVAPSTTKSSPDQTILQSPDQQRSCCPKVNTVNIQSLGKDTNGVDDLVKVNWTTQLGNSDCLNVLGSNVSVKTTHVNRATCRSDIVFVTSLNGEVNPIKAKCGVEETGNTSVQSIQATVAPKLKVGNCYVSVRKEGSF